MELNSENYHPGGGRFYSSLVWHYTSALVIILFGLFALIPIVIVSIPTKWIAGERAMKKVFDAFDSVFAPLERWRRWIQCRIYLGMDPRVWDALTK